MARSVLSGAILLTLAVALICQFVQRTDSIFPLLYFTVDSAVFAGVVAGIALVNPEDPRLPQLRAASTVAVVVSALIFATVIAPASETGTWVQPHDDPWVRTATFLFHLVAPILVIADFVAADIEHASLRSILAGGLAWPLSYLATLSVVGAAGLARIPYPFLDHTRVGWWVVAGAIAGLAALIVVLTTALYALNRWRHAGRI